MARVRNACDLNEARLRAFFGDLRTVAPRVMAPARWTTRAFPSSPAPHRMYPGDLQVEERISEEVRAELRKRGHKLTVSGPYPIGSNGAILSEPVKGYVAAGADPRNSALALAW